MSLNKKQGSNYNEGNFRWMDFFDLNMINNIGKRNGVAKFAAYGLPDEAMREGFDTVVDGEIWEGSDDINDVVQPLIRQVNEGAGHERLYSANTHVLETRPSVIKDIPEAKEDLFLFNVNPITPAYETEFGKFGNLEKLKFDINIADNQPREMKLSGDQMKTTFFNMLRPSLDNFRLGESRLQPIWDNIIALGAVGNNSTNYLIRVGSGIKIMYMDINDFMDDETRGLMETFLKNLNSMSSYALAPTRPKDTHGRSELDINTGGGQINFQEIFDINAAFVATDLNLPLNRIKGIYQGETVGAGVTRSLYFGSLRMIQQDYQPNYTWLVRILGKMGFYKAPPDNFQIDFRFKYELGEADAVIIHRDRLDIAQVYMNTFGLEPNEALKAAGLKEVATKTKEDLDKEKQAFTDQFVDEADSNKKDQEKDEDDKEEE